MLVPRTLNGVVGWWRHVAPRRFDLSSARIVGCSMWAIGAGGQEARLPFAYPCGVGYGSILPSSDVVLDAVSLFGYREPNGVTKFVFV